MMYATRNEKRQALLAAGWTPGRCWDEHGVEEWTAPNGDYYHLTWVPGSDTYYAFNPMAG